MASYDDDLLDAAQRLLTRRSGQRGKLHAANVRRSISTSYYAMFHFLLEEAGLRLIGSHNDLRRRRRVLARSFTHSGIKATLDKVKGTNIDKSVEEFFRWSGAPAGRLRPPAFAQTFANVFAKAQAKRLDADYDLNDVCSVIDARLTRILARDAIKEWRSATTPEDRDFKNSLYVLMLLKGQLRREY